MLEYRRKRQNTVLNLSGRNEFLKSKIKNLIGKEIRDKVLKLSERLYKRELTRRSFLQRLIAMIGIVYILLWIQLLGLIGGSIIEGIYWTAGYAGSFFPIPHPPGLATVMTPASLLDTIIYLIFLQGGIWILWLTFFILYVFSPYGIRF